jgi:hypothetical protein
VLDPIHRAPPGARARATTGPLVGGASLGL